MVDLAIAPVGLGTHGLEKTAAANCWLKAVASRLLDNQRNPCVCIMKEDNVGVVDLDELKEIGEDNLLRPLEPCSRSFRAWMHEISLGKFGSPATTSIPTMLKGTWKSERTWTRLFLRKGNRSFSARYR
jgi:hypothetical protein